MADPRDKKFRAARAEAAAMRTRIQRDTAAELTRILKEADERIRLQLGSLPTDWQTFFLPQLQAAIRQAMTEIGDRLGTQISSGAASAWEAGVTLIDAPLAAGGIQVAAYAPAISTQQLLAMRTFASDRIKNISLTLANRINTELGLAALGGQTTSEAASKIQLLLNSSRSRALTIVRTDVGGAFSTATFERQRQAAEIVPGLKRQWRRSGKLHSRPHHDMADGQIKDVDEPFVLTTPKGIVKLRYPRDPQAPIGERINCGCEALPYMEHWDVQNPGRKPYTDQELTSSARQALAGAEPLPGN